MGEGSVGGIRITKVGFNVAPALPIGQLGETEAKKLIQARKAKSAKITVISAHAFLKLVVRGSIPFHDYRENHLANIHAPLSRSKN